MNVSQGVSGSSAYGSVSSKCPDGSSPIGRNFFVTDLELGGAVSNRGSALSADQASVSDGASTYDSWHIEFTVSAYGVFVYHLQAICMANVAPVSAQ